MVEQWMVKGDLYDICSCNVNCPCWLGVSPPTKNGICEALIAFDITDGNYGNIRLGGLKAVMAGVIPGLIGSGNWIVALYFDEKANDAQRKALGAIFSGEGGGQPKALGGFIGKMLGVKFAGIDIIKEGKKVNLKISGIAAAEFQPVEGADKKEMKLSNTPWAGYMGVVESLSVGRTSLNAYSDKEYVWSWENSGKSVISGPFIWKGP